jgi:glucose/arabinose dehydrogenase
MFSYHVRQRLLLMLAALGVPTLTACGQISAAQAPIPTAVPISTRVVVPTQQPSPTTEPTAASPEATSAPTQPAAPPVVPPEDAASARLQVPAGFAVRIYAQLDNPRLMTVGPDGHLYVAERGARAVVRLPDRDGDGLADAREVVAEGLGGVHNVEWFQGSLYAADASQVTRLTDTNNDGDMLDAGEQAFVVALPTGGNHTSRTLHFGPDGMLYVSAGSTGNIEPETDLRRGTIMRYAPDGSIPADNPFANDPDPNLQPVWAEGLRNSVDFLFLPDVGCGPITTAATA